MNLLSPEIEINLVDKLLELCEERVIGAIEQRFMKPPYIQQKELIVELGISHSYLRKLETFGLQRIQLDALDKNVFYKRTDVYELLEKFKVIKH